MPGQVRMVTDEQDGLLAFLAGQREVIVLAAYGLTDEQARATPSASALSVGGLIKHVSATEDGWIDTVLRKPPAGQEDYVDNFSFTEDDTLGGVIDRYREVGARTEEVVAGISDLDQPVPVPRGGAVVPAGSRGVVGALGAVPPDPGDRPARRACRHRPGVDRRRDRVSADGRRGELAGHPVDAALEAAG